MNIFRIPSIFTRICPNLTFGEHPNTPTGTLLEQHPAKVFSGYTAAKQKFEETTIFFETVANIIVDHADRNAPKSQ